MNHSPNINNTKPIKESHTNFHSMDITQLMSRGLSLKWAIVKVLMIFILFVGVAIGQISTTIHNYISVGDEFMYEENITVTTVNIVTGERNVTLTETNCTERIADLEYKSENQTGKIERSCTWVRITPPDDREEHRLLSDHSLMGLESVITPSGNIRVNKYWSKDLSAAMGPSTKAHYLVSRIHYNEEYETEVVTIESDTPASYKIQGVTFPFYIQIKDEIDTNTGAIISKETFEIFRYGPLRRTTVTIKKLIPRKLDTRNCKKKIR